MTMVSKKAPQFRAPALIDGKITTVDWNTFAGSYKVLFFYPLDFTFVCPTELHAFQDKWAQFTQKNVHVIGCSVDSVHSHWAWWNTPKEKGGIAGVRYPLISDMNKTIARNYGVLKEDEGVALRGVFLIDKDDTVQAALVNNLSLGRNIDEVMRLVDALQWTEKNGDVCPANWAEGKVSMKPTHEGVSEYFGG